MTSSDDPLNTLPSETRKRVEDALQALGSGGAFQGVTPVFVTHSTDATIQQAQSSKAWTHWEYSPEEWALFDRIDWGSRRRIFSLLVGGSIVFLIATILSVLTELTTSPEQVTFIFALLLCILFAMACLALFIFSVAYLASYREARKRHKARQSQPESHRVTISPKGVWEAGTYFPIDDDDLTVDLRKVEMTTEPPVLHFHRAITRTHDESLPQSTTLRVLVPRGHEEEATYLMQRFRTEVIKPSRQAGKPWGNLPEPD